MKSFAYWKHEIVYAVGITVMIFLMIVTRPFNNEYTWRVFETKVFSWLEKGHVDN